AQRGRDPPGSRSHVAFGPEESGPRSGRSSTISSAASAAVRQPAAAAKTHAKTAEKSEAASIGGGKAPGDTEPRDTEPCDIGPCDSPGDASPPRLPVSTMAPKPATTMVPPRRRKKFSVPVAMPRHGVLSEYGRDRIHRSDPAARQHQQNDDGGKRR